MKIKDPFIFIAIFFTLISGDCIYEYGALIKNESLESGKIKYGVFRDKADGGIEWCADGIPLNLLDKEQAEYNVTPKPSGFN